MPHERMLVTGGAGFIGANFVHYWMQRYPERKLVVLDALTYAGIRASLDPLNANPNFKFVHGDILDEALVEQILRDHDINTIVHFAAESHVDRSIAGPDPFLSTNVMGTHSMLKVARKLWAGGKSGAFFGHRFHHVSTDEVYGTLGMSDPGFTEDSPYRPNSPYAASKAAADHLVRAYCNTYGLNATISNCSNNHGPYQFPEKLIPLVIINVLHGREIPVYGRGLNVRDWLFVEDHCRGIELILENGQKGETYNIGGNAEMSNIDLVNLLCAELDELFSASPSLAQRFPQAPAASGGKAAALIRFVKDRPGHDLRYAVDGTRIRARLGFVPGQTLKSGLARTIGWYLQNEPWWRAVMNQDYDTWMAAHYAGRGGKGN